MHFPEIPTTLRQSISFLEFFFFSLGHIFFCCCRTGLIICMRPKRKEFPPSLKRNQNYCCSRKCPCHFQFLNLSNIYSVTIDVLSHPHLHIKIFPWTLWVDSFGFIFDLFSLNDIIFSYPINQPLPKNMYAIELSENSRGIPRHRLIFMILCSFDSQ